MNPAASVVRCVFLLVVSLAAAAAQPSPTLFPSDDFPFTSWQLPPVNPAETPPKGWPPYFPIKDLLATAARQRIVSCEEDEKSATLTATLDEHLDLAAELSRASGRHAATPVPLGPRIVAGQGSDPGNLTFVKILNQRGIADVQFLAYDPAVKGGVNVAAARNEDHSVRIAAAPISDGSVNAIRIFNEHGGLTGLFRLPADVPPPVLIVGGDFLSENPGGEFIISPRSGAGASVIVNADGVALRSLGRLLGDQAGSELRIEPVPNEKGGDDLFVNSGKHWQRLFFDGKKAVSFDAKLDRPTTGVFPNVFDPDSLLVATENPLQSVWLETADGISFRPRDVGSFENRFWYDLGSRHAGSTATWNAPAEGRFVRQATYLHQRTEGSSPRSKEPASLEKNPLWTKAEADDFSRRIFSKYDKPLTDQPILMWEPTFTHRMNESFRPWMEVADPRTKLPRYAALDRDGRPAGYSEGVGAKKSEFLIATYAFGLPALDSYFVQSLRGFLNALSPRFRADPEQVFSMEPNHEHEINLGKKDSIGDFNPKMVEGFFIYLAGLYGGDIGHINKVMGTPFTTHFDAPRNLGRGPWDETSDRNPFYNAWYFYNRYVVNRRIANTFRESLLAGFPPEVIKSHQIPDSFAVASTKEFSTTQARITPVDYTLSAGVGFGYTNYGVWYQKDNMLASAHSSGFDNIILGEYNALSPDVNASAEQLKYIFDNGGIGVHCMFWPTAWNPKSPEINKAMEAAVVRLRADERPRPGSAGGIGRVVPFRDGARAMNIASLGTGGNHTGLIKSLRADGTWEGSVYTAPFRTAIRVDAIASSSERPAAGVTRISSAVVNGLEGGDQIEISFHARSSAASKLRFSVTHQGFSLSGLGSDLGVTTAGKNYRLVLRSPLPAGGIVVSIEHGDATSLTDLKILRETSEIARPHVGKMTGVRNQGGVTFDLLD